MSDTWTTVTHKKKKKKKQKVDANIIKMKTSKPKIKNYIKESIIKHIDITDDDLPLFRTWKHDYLVGKIINKDTNSIFRKEDKYLILEYINKFKIYKNYNKVNEKDFLNIYNNLTLDKELFLELVRNDKLFVNNKLLQDIYGIENIEKNI